MLTQPLIAQMETLGLRGMIRALESQAASPDASALAFEDRLSLLVQHEMADRQAHRLSQRLRWAKLPQPACIEDLDVRATRGIERGRLTQFADLGWIDQRLNLLITGPTGVGKSYIACALAQQACRQDKSVRYFRLTRLTEDLLRAGAQQKKSAFFKHLAKADLVVLDDFGLAPLADEIKRDLLEILDDRFDKTSTLVTSQLPVEQWHRYLDDPTLADAILDRLVHNAHRLELKGESMRRKKAA
ncbi:MAG: IS21-like element helper ATPase IstB [Nevskiaceae bacterium]